VLEFPAWMLFSPLGAQKNGEKIETKNSFKAMLAAGFLQAVVGVMG